MKMATKLQKAFEADRGSICGDAAILLNECERLLGAVIEDANVSAYIRGDARVLRERLRAHV